MRILVACEESQAVCKEFRDRGHEAFSADILETSGDSPEWHIKGDVLPLIDGNCTFVTQDGKTHEQKGTWDMLLAFPPCTHLAVSGAAWFERKRKSGEQESGIEFFMKFINAECPKICIENPVGIISGEYIAKHFPELQRKYGFPIPYSQAVQPYEFGDSFSKKTCLWLKGLPKLTSTKEVSPGEFKEWTCKKTGRVKRQATWFFEAFKLSPQDRAKVISKTFPGIAKAMAEQWSVDLWDEDL